MSIHNFVFSSIPCRIKPAEDPAPGQLAEISLGSARDAGTSHVESLTVLIDAHSRAIVSALGGDLRVSDLLAFLAGAVARHGCPTALRLVDHDAAILIHGSCAGGKTAVIREALRALRGGKLERLHQRAQDTAIEHLDKSQDSRKPGDARRED